MNKLDEIKQNKREKALQDIKLWIANDWELEEETPEYFLMTKNNATPGGHFWVFLFTFWFTLGLGNIMYHFCSKKKKKIIK